MANENDPFADMEVDWEKTEKAAPGMSTGRIPPFPEYRGVCVAFDATGDGTMVDHQFLQPEGKNPGVKIQIEILEPAEVEGEGVKGKSYEHVFWISPANWPYVKRDVETITGIEPKHPKELLSMVWAGRTVEFGIKDDKYNGFVRSKSTHFNTWAPEKAAGKKDDATKKVEPKPGQQKPTSPAKGNQAAKGATAGKGNTNVDF